MKGQKAVETAAATYYTQREQRLELQRTVDAMEKEEKLALAALQKALGASGVDQHTGGGYKITTARLTVPTVVDGEMLWEWGQKPANRPLLTVGVIAADWRKLVANGVEVPGVESYTRETVKVVEAG
jgi:hypothetical protein